MEKGRYIEASIFLRLNLSFFENYFCVFVALFERAKGCACSVIEFAEPFVKVKPECVDKDY